MPVKTNEVWCSSPAINSPFMTYNVEILLERSWFYFLDVSPLFFLTKSRFWTQMLKVVKPSKAHFGNVLRSLDAMTISTLDLHISYSLINVCLIAHLKTVVLCDPKENKANDSKDSQNCCWWILYWSANQQTVSSAAVCLLSRSNVDTSRPPPQPAAPVLSCPCRGLDVPSPPPPPHPRLIPACAPYSTLVVPRSAVCEAPPSTMFRMVTGGPIREQHLAAGQKQNNSPHAVRDPFMQTSADLC